jgi:phospholipid-binding lipoprotein MlaA
VEAVGRQAVTQKDDKMNKNTLTRIFAMTAAGVGLAGCATVQNPDPRDPWEGFNRGVYTFNDKVDRAVLRPIAVGYTKITPQPVQSCIHNMFNNVADIWGAANSMLQGRGVDAINTFGRFLFNTTMGVAGCFDVATANGAKRIPNDFGTTLGVWGIGQGPYLVLPFWGSSTIRDTAGLAGDFVGNQWTSVGAIDNVPLRNSLYGLLVVDRRASLLSASDTVDRVALDPYSFVRDAYLQRRAAMVLGGKAGDTNNLPNYDEDGGDNGSKPAGTGTVPAGPGIGGAGAGTSTPAPARQ